MIKAYFAVFVLVACGISLGVSISEMVRCHKGGGCYHLTKEQLRGVVRTVLDQCQKDEEK